MLNNYMNTRRITFFISCLISLFAFSIYYESLFYGESNYDDHVYFNYLASVLKDGLNFTSLFSMMSDFVNSNWHPITVLSLAFDYIVSDKNPVFFHFINTWIHILNAILVYIVFFKLSKNIYASALTAFLFTVHPLNIETVVWISERKGLLSTFFALYSMYFYILYKEKLLNHLKLFSIVLFSCSLLSKPTTAPLVFVLILLDVTVFNHCEKLNIKVLLYSIFDKYQYFIIGAAIIILSFMAQSETGALRDLSSVTVLQRLETGIYNVFIYISKIYIPINLASYYPHPDKPLYIIILYTAFIITWLYMALRYFSHYKIITFCILFFFILIVPQSGIFQTGSHSIANRYSYLPSVGMFFILSYGISLISNKRITVILSLLLIITLTSMSIGQSKAWRSNLSLWEHNANVTEKNYYTAYFYSMLLAQDGRVIEAAKYFYNIIGIKNKFYGNTAITDFSRELTKREYFNEAKAILLKGIDNDFREKDIISQLSLLEYFNFNNKVSGEKYIQSVLAVAPEDFHANRIYAKMLYDQKKYNDALFVLNKLYENKENYNSDGEESIESIINRDLKLVQDAIN